MKPQEHNRQLIRGRRFRWLPVAVVVVAVVVVVFAATRYMLPTHIKPGSVVLLPDTYSSTVDLVYQFPPPNDIVDVPGAKIPTLPATPRPGVVFTRHQLVAAVWANHAQSPPKALAPTSTICTDCSGDATTTSRRVATVRGSGYRLGSG